MSDPRERRVSNRPAAAAPSRTWRLRKWIGGAVGAVVLAAVVAFASGLGNKAAEGVGNSDGAPISYSVEEQSNRCLGGTFLPNAAAQEVLEEGPIEGPELITKDPAAAAVGRDMVQVAIQGESERKVTLTGIEFRVERAPSPRGSAFSFPCGGPTVGRALEVDLDANPPAVTASSAEVGGMVGFYNGKPLSAPIHFPWTVSLTDPLLLEIFGTTDRCYCTWTAEIPWVSGAKQGIIAVENHGEGFRVIGRDGLNSYGVGPGGKWTQVQ